MIEFKRYPHVGELISHYASALENGDIVSILNNGAQSGEEAYTLSRFVITVIDRMVLDMQENNLVLGNADNTNIIPDIDYEISLYLANRGMDVWDQVCNAE